MWINVPGTTCHCAPAEADSTSAWNSSLATHFAQSVGLSGKLSPSSSWLRGWKKHAWLKRLFGRTCEPSTASRGVESWIQSVQESRANLTPRPDPNVRTRIHDTFGPTLLESLAKFPRATYSWRTWRDSSNSDTRASKRTFIEWVIELRRGCLQRKKSVLRMNGNDCSSSPAWRTPIAMDVGVHLDKLTNKEGGPPELGRRMYLNGKHHTQTLGLQACLWSPPPSHPALSKIGKGFRLTFGRRLNPVFVSWLMGWPLIVPTGSDSLAKEWCHYKQRMRSQLLLLVTNNEH